VGITDIQYTRTWRTTYEGDGVKVILEFILKSESYMKVTVSRKNFIKMERCTVSLGRTLFAIALSGICTLTFILLNNQRDAALSSRIYSSLQGACFGCFLHHPNQS
jgi:hypothetical protein